MGPAETGETSGDHSVSDMISHGHECGCYSLGSAGSSLLCGLFSSWGGVRSATGQRPDFIYMTSAKSQSCYAQAAPVSGQQFVAGFQCSNRKTKETDKQLNQKLDRFSVQFLDRNIFGGDIPPKKTYQWPRGT